MRAIKCNQLRVRVEYEMIANEARSAECAESAITISDPSSASGMIVLLKTINKCCCILLISLCKNKQKTI